MEVDHSKNDDVNTKLLQEFKDQSTFNPNKKKVSEERDNTNSKYEMILYMIIVTFLFFVLILIFYYMHYGEYKVELIYEDKDIIKPIVDTRNYKLIKLENNLEVLLISDRNSSICSAALSVEVGSFKDDLIPGLAHFTGHALYLGSKLYPEPSAFENHLNHYFGKSNAFTTDDKTVFYFEVGWQGFEKAIEMFSKMFEEPLFDEANLNLEIDAINSEHENNLNKDSWKENQIIKSLADKNHPYSNFGTGNSDTLRGVQFRKLIEKMKNLYDEYYLPNYMKLVVMTNQNMEQLQYTVSYYFSDLRKTQEQQLIRKINENESEMDNTKNETISYKTKPYSTDNLGQVIWYKKIAGGQHLDVIFILDEIFSKYHIKPLDLISYHFKYSGEGSLINYLKTNKLANKLDVGVVSSFKTFSIYGISLYLNEEGLRKVKDVIQLVFNYLNLIKSNGINQSTYDEIKSSKKVSFKFTEKSDLIREEIARLAANMLNYKQEDHNDILYVDYFHSAFNETVIRKDIGQLEPENSLIIIGSTSFPDGQLNELIDSDLEVEQEQWYGTDYKKNKLTKEYLHTLKSVPITGETFKLRSSNEFITKENDIVSCYGVGIVASYKNNTLQEICQEEFMDLTPKLVIDSKNIKIWHKLDRSYLAPRVNVYFQFLSHFLKITPKEYLYMNIYYNHLKTHINLKLSDAKEAGNDIKVEFYEDGLFIFISCFTDLVEKITEIIIDIMFNLKIDKNEYNQMIDISKIEMESHKKDQPYEKAIQIFNKIIKRNVFLYPEVAGVTKSASFSEFTKILEQIKSTFYVVSEFYGYINKETIKIIESIIHPYMDMEKTHISKAMKIPDYSIYDYFHSHKQIEGSIIYRALNDLKTELNNVVLNFFQVGRRDKRKGLMMDLITLVWDNMFYYNLRTVKQLGYVVSSQKYIKDNHLYFVFLLQGSKSIPNKMNTDFDEIILLVEKKLEYLDSYQFNEFKDNLAMRLLKSNTNLKESSDQVWEEIINGSLEFNRRYELFDELKNIHKSDIIRLYREIFFEDVKKLSIQIFSHKNVEDAVQLIIKREENYNLNTTIISKVTNDLKILK